jgi:cyclophilin family peptidyl-prolyl cis-trans isomerase
MITRVMLIAAAFAVCSMTQPATSQESHGKKQEEESKKTTIQKTVPDKKPAMKETPLGIIEIELFQADAPKTVENFVKLTEKKYFNGIIFHRVSKGFVIQGGDPSGNGTGGKSIWGKEFADELNPAAPSYKEGYKRGVVAMANRGPNTNTSQFFIMLVDNTMMPKNYTIFGKVASGMEVVDRIGSTDIIPQMGPTDGKPKNDIVMKTVTIIKMPDGKPHVKVEVVQREPIPAGK